MTNIKHLFQISPSSGVPIYRQLMDQVKILAATERLPAEEFLPSVRQVAEALEINPMTVSKAYSLLEKEGVLEFVRGEGMRLAPIAPLRKSSVQRQEEIVPYIEEVIRRAHQLQLDRKKVQQLWEQLWRDNNE